METTCEISLDGKLHSYMDYIAWREQKRDDDYIGIPADPWECILVC